MRAVILDCYTVEPSGLGVPPFISTYVRDAYGALCQTGTFHEIAYLTIDDVRATLIGSDGPRPPLTNPFVYSVTANRPRCQELLEAADLIIIVAGDKVPSVHLHAVNGSAEEIAKVMANCGGRKVLLGPMASFAGEESLRGVFDAVHSHTITADDLLASTSSPAAYELLRQQRPDFSGLVTQMRWQAIAEIELYRGCTRRVFCSFCNEPSKNPVVDFRPVDDVLDEISALYRAGLRHFRLGQQTCFFSYQNRDADAIQALLVGIRDRCPEIGVLHIDNADPLAVASKSGARIARIVAEYCTDGNCAAMGQESFDPTVIAENHLTCTPDVLRRAIDNVNEAGRAFGPHGLPQLLPGINLVYGLPGETSQTHELNLAGLHGILEAGYLCHRTNIRQVRTYPGTPLERAQDDAPRVVVMGFEECKAQITQAYEVPMKRRVYPIGHELRDLHSFFVTERGTWHRRLGSYSIQVVERGVARPLFETATLRVVDHAGRYIYGERVA